jgi:hypothetical protein
MIAKGNGGIDHFLPVNGIFLSKQVSTRHQSPVSE